MAEFVKAGQRLINRDLVTDIEIYAIGDECPSVGYGMREVKTPEVVIHLAAPAIGYNPGDVEARAITLTGDEAGELLGEIYYRKSGPNGTGARKASDLATVEGVRA